MGRHVGALLGALLVAGRAIAAEPEVEEEISPWETSITLRGGGGYKNNILLSDFNREESAFTLASVDFFIYHAPENQWEFSEFFTIEDRRYWQSEEVDKE